MSDPRINLKNPRLAAVLGYLIPGAGHAYQGRWFKAAIYAIGVWGLFIWGMSLGEWKIVYFRWQAQEKTIGYLSQVLVGLPALPALVQSYRYKQAKEQSNRGVGSLDLPIHAPFRGYAKHESRNQTWEGAVSGQIQLSVEDGQFGPEVKGQFRGVLEAEGRRQIELSLTTNPDDIAPRLLASGNVTRRLDGQNRDKEFSSSERYIQCRIVERGRGFESPVGQLEGTIPRSFWDWYQMPLEEDPLQDLNRRLGRRYEMALLFTWIAGLLNLLAVWDALEGPAYGYGDEEEQADGQPRDVPNFDATAAPFSASVAATSGNK
jgi:hypothetical protein